MVKRRRQKGLKKVCSLNWRNFSDNITLVFTRDESVQRVKALPPVRFSKAGVEYVMPVDPAGQGSWIASNNKGFVFFLLNDYQGALKPQSMSLNSRGQLVRQLAECSSLVEVKKTVENWELSQSQPFYLGIISQAQSVSMLYHYDGRMVTLTPQPLPEQLYSSGDPDVANIILQRTAFVDEQVINTPDDLVLLHQQHKPSIDNKRVFSLCMHRPEAESQSLTVIQLYKHQTKLTYYADSPCKASQHNQYEMTLQLLPA